MTTDAPDFDSSVSIGPLHRLNAVEMPLENPVEGFREAVENLKLCNLPELRQARKHHRRALASLQDGGYHCLSDTTRHNLADRLRNNLAAINEALNALTKTTAASDASGNDSLSDRFRTFFQGLW